MAASTGTQSPATTETGLRRAAPFTSAGTGGGAGLRLPRGRRLRRREPRRRIFLRVG